MTSMASSFHRVYQRPFRVLVLHFLPLVNSARLALHPPVPLCPCALVPLCPCALVPLSRLSVSLLPQRGSPIPLSRLSLLQERERLPMPSLLSSITRISPCQLTTRLPSMCLYVYFRCILQCDSPAVFHQTCHSTFAYSSPFVIPRCVSMSYGLAHPNGTRPEVAPQPNLSGSFFFFFCLWTSLASWFWGTVLLYSPFPLPTRSVTNPSRLPPPLPCPLFPF